MAEQENEESAHLRRSACVACTYHCNKIHGDRVVEEEQFDPNRSWPFFRKKVSKFSVHQAPQSAICIPPEFMEDYPNTFQKGTFTTLEGPSGNTWKVAAVDRSVLHLGWRAFAHDHCLREGDVLSFRLAKPSHFIVDIFNANGDVRRSARNARVTGKYSVDPETPDRSRKRKEMETDHTVRTNVAGQRKPSTKRGPADDYRLKFCEKTKQWKSYEGRDGREVVNLDSDDEEPKGQTVARRDSTWSQMGRLVEFMREEEQENDDALPAPTPTPPVNQVINSEPCEDHQVVERTLKDIITGHGQDNSVAHEQQEDDDYRLDEEQDLIASNPLRQFTTMFDTRPRKTKEDLTVENPAIEVKQQAQVSCDPEDMVRVKEDSTHLARIAFSDTMEVDNTLKSTRRDVAHVESSVAMPSRNSSPQPVQKIEDRTTVDCTSEQRLKAQSSNPHADNLNTIPPKSIQYSALEAYQKSASSSIQRISGPNLNTAAPDHKVLSESCIETNPSIAQAAAASEPVTDAHANSSQITLPTSASAMPESKLSAALNGVTTDVNLAIAHSSQLQEKVQEAEEFSFDTQENNYANIGPSVTDTTHEGQRDSPHPLKETLISQDSSIAKKLDTLKLNEDDPILKAHLTKCTDTGSHEEYMFQATPPSTPLKDRELHLTKMESEKNPITNSPVSEIAKENQTVPSTNEMPPPPEEIGLQLKPGNEAESHVLKETANLESEVNMVGHPKRKLEFKELTTNTTDSEGAAAQVTEKKVFNTQAKPTAAMSPKTEDDTCVLISKRGRVTQANRDRALQSAQEWSKKLSNPHFIAVMTNTNVYTNFDMDIPVKFVKQSKMPLREVRVTLVSETPPTNCKVIWKPGSNDTENARLNANGWMNFARTHFLEEGDVCVFEDLNKYPAFRIGVYIFRVVELTKPVSVLDWERHYKVNPPPHH